MSITVPMSVEDTYSSFEARIPAARRALITCLEHLYGKSDQTSSLVDELIAIAHEAYRQRPDSLKTLDAKRLADPQWFKSSRMVGYTSYVDRFAGTLNGVAERVSHLDDLGVTYLHLLPLMEMREGRSDGGFAPSSYERIESRFGTMSDLENLAETLRDHDISLCIDFVCNHAADTHDWAMKAKAGDPHYRDYFYVYPDRQLPDQFEQTVPEIFAETAPGNFTEVDELDGWVWTTFYPYQWDLNYSNPNVLKSMAAAMLNLANHGVEIFRLDAAPFLWKESGTKCQSLPQVHSILQIFRALTDLATPCVLLKAEAIVPSDELIKYVGGGDSPARECHLAYNTVFMGLVWAALAHGSVRRLNWVMQKMPDMPEDSTWLAYVRCHDDIGWAPLLGEQPIEGRRDWLDYALVAANRLSGIGEGAIGEGRAFQTGGDPDVVHGTSGTAASLCGLGKALRKNDHLGVEKALDRITLLYSTVMAFGGIPLINMGDEIGLLNDEHFESRNSYDGDSRWIHRGLMDWDLANAKRGISAELRTRMEKIIALRNHVAPRSGSTNVHALENETVLAFTREDESKKMLFVANFSEAEQSTDLPEGVWQSADTPSEMVQRTIHLKGYETLWLTLVS